MDNELKEALNSAILSAVSNFSLMEIIIIKPRNWDDSSARIFKLLLAEGILIKEDVLNLINDRLKGIGRYVFVEHTQHKKEIAHTTMPPMALAYALDQGEFTKDEVSCINFSEDETEEQFIKTYNKPDLREEVFGMLITEKLEIPPESLLTVSA